MFHERQMNNKRNHPHECTLRIVHEGNLFLFEQLLEKDEGVNDHHRILQTLAIEFFKLTKGISVSTMNDIFSIKEYTMGQFFEINGTKEL